MTDEAATGAEPGGGRRAPDRGPATATVGALGALDATSSGCGSTAGAGPAVGAGTLGSGPASAAAPLPPPVRRRSGRILTALVVVAAGVAAWRVRATLGDAVVAIAALDGWTLLALGACWAAMLLARSSVYRWAHPRSRLAHGLVLDQVNLATGNALPGGMAVGYAARYRIGRSFGQTPHGVSLTMLAASHAFSIGRWLLVLVVLGRVVLGGAATRVDTVVAASGAAFLVAAAVGWAVLAHDCRATRWLVGRAQAVLDRAGRRIGRARDVPLVPFVDGLREGAHDLLRTRAWRVLLAGLGAAVAEATILIVVVRAVDTVGDPATWDLLRAYLLARVASSFVPTPGNVGALEGALAAGLVAAGADPAAAVAGVIVFRGLTFALPIATGAVVYGAWRRWDREQTATWAASAPPAPTVGWHDGPSAGEVPASSQGDPCSTSATPTASASSPSIDRMP